MHTTDNQALLDALARLRDAAADGMEAAMRRLLEQILTSTFITGEEDGASLVVEDDDGQPCLALFATTLDLHFFSPGAPAVELAGAQAVRQVASGSYAGVVINPGTKQFELSREDVLDYFEIDELI